jgi:hypothetical protein
VIEFKSYICFQSGKFPENWINTINVGIDSIMQFISLLYPTDVLNSKCRYLCLHGTNTDI